MVPFIAPRHGTQLLQHPKRIYLRPLLRDSAAAQTEKGRLHYRYWSTSRRKAAECSALGAAGGKPDGHPVAFCDHLFNRVLKVRKCSIHVRGSAFVLREARGLRSVRQMDQVVRRQQRKRFIEIARVERRVEAAHHRLMVWGGDCCESGVRHGSPTGSLAS